VKKCTGVNSELCVNI